MTPLQVLNAAEGEVVSLSSVAQECVFLGKLCIKMVFHRHCPTIIYETEKRPSLSLKRPVSGSAQSTLLSAGNLSLNAKAPK